MVVVEVTPDSDDVDVSISKVGLSVVVPKGEGSVEEVEAGVSGVFRPNTSGLNVIVRKRNSFNDNVIVREIDFPSSFSKTQVVVGDNAFKSCRVILYCPPDSSLVVPEGDEHSFWYVAFEIVMESIESIDPRLKVVSITSSLMRLTSPRLVSTETWKVPPITSVPDNVRFDVSDHPSKPLEPSIIVIGVSMSVGDA